MAPPLIARVPANVPLAGIQDIRSPETASANRDLYVAKSRFFRTRPSISSTRQEQDLSKWLSKATSDRKFPDEEIMLLPCSRDKTNVMDAPSLRPWLMPMLDRYTLTSRAGSCGRAISSDPRGTVDVQFSTHCA